jgi:dTDP-4-amino-4,6-dideoxygalactose transaminase
MIEYENLKKVNSEFELAYKQAFSESLDSGYYILGKKVEKFEKEFSTYLGMKDCIGVASGMDALLLSLKVWNFKPGSEVIVPSNTYIATILAILQAGLVPVLVEPDLTTYNIDPSLITKKITSATVAIMIVHLYGKSCEMDKIVKICEEHNLQLFEDCAQAHGAKFKERMTGTFGSLGAFSFYPTKNLGALGDAGAVVTNDNALGTKVRKLRNYGSSVKYYNEVIGYNSRLDELQAGFLSIKLKALDKINNHKRHLAQIYLKNLKTDFILPKVDSDYFDVYHIFAIRHPNRNELRKYLSEKMIGTEIHYPVPPHQQVAMKEIFTNQTYPIAEEIHNTILSLPISYSHTEEDIYKVIEVMNRFRG